MTERLISVLCLFLPLQVLAGPVVVDNVCNGHLMVESNATLEAQTILSALNSTDIEVTGNTLTVSDSELVAGIFLEKFLLSRFSSSLIQ